MNSSDKKKMDNIEKKILETKDTIAKISLMIKKEKNTSKKKALKKALKKAKNSLNTLNKQKTSLQKTVKWKKRISSNNKSGKYEIWITYNSNKKRLQIPVLPEKIEVSYPEKNDAVYVYGVGEVTIKKHPGAFVMKWSCFFPKSKCQGSISNPKSPKDCIDFLKAVMELETAAKIVFTGGPMRVSSLCTIKFDCDEVAGDTGTVNYSITVTEYKKTKVKKLKIKKKGGKKKAKVKKNSNRSNTKVKAGQYIVKKGDCLWNIARKFYGKGAKYTIIYNANKKVIGSNPNKIYPGQVLKIPKE